MKHRQFSFDLEFSDIINEVLFVFSDSLSRNNQRNPQLSRMMAFFYLYKEFTQKELQEKMKLSSGMISTLIRQLLETKMIRKENIDGTNEHVYVMSEMPYLNLDYFMYIIKRLGQLKKDYETLRQDLNSLPSHVQALEEYSYFRNFIEKSTQMLAPLELFQKIFDEELANFHIK